MIEKKRESNFELLRIISILMVIILHCLGGIGKVLDNVKLWSFNFYGAVFLESFSIIAVNCFVFITGYFQIKKNKINIEKLIRLFTIVVIWYIFLYIIGIILGDINFSIISFIFTVIPIMKAANWYINTYIILMILSPYINNFLIILNEQQYRKLLILMIFIFSIIPTFLPISTNNDWGYGIVTFILIYSIAGYIRLFKDEFNKEKKNYLIKWFLCSLTVFILSLLSYKLINSSNAWGYNNIFNILSAMYLFLYFKNIEIKSKLINYLATFSFSIYIIHTNPYIERILYEKLLHFNKYYNDKFILIYVLIVSLIIFSGCILLEQIRRFIFSIVLHNRFLKKRLEKIKSKFIKDKYLELEI